MGSPQGILHRVTTWEAEALKHLPLIMTGGRPPRYITFGGIDAFNAKMTDAKRRLSPAKVLTQLDDTHERLLAFVRRMPARHFTDKSRARRRLRLDTYGHYPEHAEAIRRWRRRAGA